MTLRRHREELIVHAHEIKPVWRRNHATAAPIARIARSNKIIDAPSATTYMFERARNRAHLGVQKRFCARLDVNFLGCSYNIEPLQCADRTCRLAFGRTKG